MRNMSACKSPRTMEASKMKWYCENHPEHEMGHNGCEGAGIPEDARFEIAMIQRRNALQMLKEMKSYYEFIIKELIELIKEIES